MEDAREWKLGQFLSKGFTEVKEEDKRYFAKEGKLEKHYTVNVFPQ
jgi:hypothetical protein